RVRQPQNLPSFPTRRSSDLEAKAILNKFLYASSSISEIEYFISKTPSNASSLKFHFFNESDFTTVRPNGTFSIFLILMTLLGRLDRKSTRLNSSHVKISYAV